MDRKLWDTWLEFVNKALEGSEGARKEFERLAGSAYEPEALATWVRTWFPQGSEAQVEEVLDKWWRVMGVVPRQRYLEVLEQNDGLRRRLAEAERTVERLRSQLAGAGAPEEVKRTLDEWEATTRKVLDAQTELTRKWTESVFGESADRDSEEGG